MPEADADAIAMPRLRRNVDDEDDEEKAIAAETTSGMMLRERMMSM